MQVQPLNIDRKVYDHENPIQTNCNKIINFIVQIFYKSSFDVNVLMVM